MVIFQPDPEWFKKGPYAAEWKGHADKVQKLIDKLIDQFPALKGGIRPGLGALTNEWLQMPPDRKNGPDLMIYYKYKVLCHIEVSGTDSPRVHVPPHDIWIRPGKIDVGVEKETAGEKYWFYMVYSNNTVVLAAAEAAPYRKKVVYRTLYGKRERYCDIPHSVSHPETELFQWLADELKSR